MNVKNNVLRTFASTAVIGTLLIAGAASAQTTTAAPTATGAHSGWMRGAGMHRAPGVFGTVASISGTSLTVTSKGFGPNASATPTTYTVDASNATVTKAGAASSVSAIAVGDMVMVQGTVSGTNVTATAIRDGMMMRGGQHPTPGSTGQSGQAPIVTGNGEPVVGGAVTAVSGDTLTVTNKSNVTYSVDATNATVEKANASSSLSAIAVGDNVIVQGAVNGTSITASSVIDSGASVANTNTSGGSAMPAPHAGFMGAIGGIFQRLFGFF